jgi:hypothetical protein
MATIKCPACGEVNPAELEFCRNCQTRIQQSDTGNLRSAGGPIQPGQSPTKKSTAELEPILPQWLRDARKEAREGVEAEQIAQNVQRPVMPANQVSDLLAGLQSQSADEDEDVPDWLANITGKAPKPEKAEPVGEDTRWVELGGEDNTPPPPGVSAATNRITATQSPSRAIPDSPLPSWLAGMDSSPQPGGDEMAEFFSRTTPKQGESLGADQAGLTGAGPGAGDVLFQPQGKPSETESSDWLKSLQSEQSPSASVEAQDNTPFDVDLPDWLKGSAPAPVNAASQAPVFSDTPDWMKGLDAETPAIPTESATPLPSDEIQSRRASDASVSLTERYMGATRGSASTDQKNLGAEQAQPAQPSYADTPDWLKGLTPEAAPAPSVDTPDWLKGLTSEAAPAPSTDTPDWLRGPTPEAAPPAPAPSADTPDWLKGLTSEAVPSSSADTPDWLKGPTPEAAPPAPSADTPDWLKGLTSEAAPSSSTDTPDWLKGFASEAEVAAPTPSSDKPNWMQGAVQEKPVSESDAFSDDVPDWLKSVVQTAPAPASDFSEQSVMDETPASAAPVFAQADSPSLFTDQGLSGDDVNSLFTQMPDWLSNAPAESKPAQETPPAAQSADAISSAALPSWVQALRPVESSFSQALAQGVGTEQTAETRGPLAGLQGVLPSMPFTPTSKPKAYSIKVQASQEQQTQAALLEHILEVETKPEPITSGAAVTSARGLRWAITLLLVFITAASLYAGTKIFAMPLLGPKELNSAIEAVEKVSENAPVLVIFDYDPSTVGEMEATAAPLLNHMILMPAPDPRLTFISTSPTGAALAERFISGPLGEHRDTIQYVNLGYLPGGLAGIRAFAQDPRKTMPVAIDSNPAWQSAPLQDVQSFSDFALILLITDSAEAGHNWVEQAGALRGDAQFVVVSSAQAGPMILPYVQSGQVNGLISGLNSGALIEERYNRQSTARRYWDAYSLGLLLAFTFILFGGLWNLALGYRARVLAAREGE